MYDKQPLLNSQKNQIAELVWRKPETSGVPDLKENIDGISSRWKDLMDKMKIHADLLEKSNQFQELCDHLNSWLSAKDKIMGVLCPVASDPLLSIISFNKFKFSMMNLKNRREISQTLIT